MAPALDVKSATEELINVLVQFPSSTHGKFSLYRGQTDATWELKPSIARMKTSGERIAKYIDDRSSERRMLTVFRDYSESVLPQWVWVGRKREVEWKTLIVAQHHRLPTRLMDWSTNPLVALYFAVNECLLCLGLRCLSVDCQAAIT